MLRFGERNRSCRNQLMSSIFQQLELTSIRRNRIREYTRYSQRVVNARCESPQTSIGLSLGNCGSYNECRMYIRSRNMVEDASRITRMQIKPSWDFYGKVNKNICTTPAPNTMADSNLPSAWTWLYRMSQTLANLGPYYADD